MTSSTTDTAAPTTTAAAAAPRRRGVRWWALSGLAAAVAFGATAVVQGTSFDAPFDPATAADPAAVAASMAQVKDVVMIWHALVCLSAALLVPFGAGLAARLRRAGGADSTLPTVAMAGVVMTATVLVIGTGLDTEFGVFADVPTMMPAEHVSFYAHWIGAVPLLWMGLGITGMATAVAAVRRQLPRWHAWTGFLLGGMTVLVSISPLQYMCILTALLWLLAVSIGLLVGDRRQAA